MNHSISRFARPLVAGLLLLAAQASLALDLKEGVHYKALKPAQPTSVAPGKSELVEVFWYACGHCYTIEPSIAAWEKKGKPANLEVVRMPAMWNNALKAHARLFYTAELLGKMPQMHTEIFREVNVKRNRLDTPESIEAFFTSRGVSKAEFDKAFSSFAVESKLRRAEDLNRRYRITSTPTFVVNGKYVTDAAMAGSEENLFRVITALAAM